MEPTNVQIIDSIKTEEPKDPFVFEAKSGVVLRLKRVSQLVYKEALAKIRNPQPPMIHIEGRNAAEPNLADPMYIQAINDNQNRQTDITLMISLRMGTEVISIPPEMDKVEDSGWSSELKEIAEIDIPDSGNTRYVAWLKFYALTDTESLEVMNAVAGMNGRLLEVDVQESIDSFRDNTNGQPNNGLSIVPPSQ